MAARVEPVRHLRTKVESLHLLYVGDRAPRLNRDLRGGQLEVLRRAASQVVVDFSAPHGALAASRLVLSPTVALSARVVSFEVEALDGDLVRLIAQQVRPGHRGDAVGVATGRNHQNRQESHAHHIGSGRLAVKLNGFPWVPRTRGEA